MNEIKIRYSKDALKFLSKSEKKSAGKIRDAIAGLTYSPPVGDIKTMQGYAITMEESGSESAHGELSTDTKMKK